MRGIHSPSPSPSPGGPSPQRSVPSLPSSPPIQKIGPETLGTAPNKENTGAEGQLLVPGEIPANLTERIISQRTSETTGSLSSSEDEALSILLASSIMQQPERAPSLRSELDIGTERKILLNVLIDGCSQLLLSTYQGEERIEEKDVRAFFKALLTAGNDPHRMAKIGAEYFPVFDSLKRSFSDENPVRLFATTLMQRMGLSEINTGNFRGEIEQLIDGLGMLFSMDRTGWIVSDRPERSVPESSTQGVTAKSSEHVPFHIAKPENLTAKPENLIYSTSVVKVAEFYETILKNSGRVITPEERETLRDFIHCMGQPGGKVRAGMIYSDHVNLFSGLKSLIYPSMRDSVRMGEMAEISSNIINDLTIQEDKDTFRTLLLDGNEFIRVFKPISILEPTLENYYNTIVGVHTQLANLARLPTIPDSAKSTFHIQLERFLHLKRIALPIIVENQEQNEKLLQLLMNVLLIPKEHEQLFSSLVLEQRIRTVYNQANQPMQEPYFPYVQWRSFQLTQGLNLESFGADEALPDQELRAVEELLSEWGAAPQAPSQQVSRSGEAPALDQVTEGLGQEPSTPAVDQESLAEVKLLCEDLKLFLEAARHATRFDPFVGLKILSLLNPTHWSLLNEEQEANVKEAFGVCINVKEADARVQGIEVLERALADMKTGQEIFKLTQFIREVVRDFDQRPELLELMKAKETSVYESQRANLEAEQKLVEEELKAGRWGSKPEAILATLWIEPAPSATVSLSSASSSHTPPAQMTPVLALRAFKGVLEIVKDKNVDPGIKNDLLKNLISWARCTNYPKLTSNPELIALAREISREVQGQHRSLEEEILDHQFEGDVILQALSERPEILKTALELEINCENLEVQLREQTGPSRSVQPLLGNPGREIDEILKSMTEKKGRLKTPTPDQLERTAQSLNEESRLVFSELDLTDLCTTPFGESFSNVAQHNNRIKAKVSSLLKSQIGDEITSENEENVLKMVNCFQSLAQTLLRDGDVNMYVAIVGGLTDHEILGKIESYNNVNTPRRRRLRLGGRKSTKMEALYSGLKELASSVSPDASFKKLRELNTKAYENYPQSNMPPPVPTVNYFGQDLTFARDGNKAIKADKTVSTVLYDIELRTFTYLSDCLNFVKRDLSQMAARSSTRK